MWQQEQLWELLQHLKEIISFAEIRQRLFEEDAKLMKH